MGKFQPEQISYRVKVWHFQASSPMHKTRKRSLINASCFADRVPGQLGIVYCFSELVAHFGLFFCHLKHPIALLVFLSSAILGIFHFYFPGGSGFFFNATISGATIFHGLVGYSASISGYRLESLPRLFSAFSPRRPGLFFILAVVCSYQSGIQEVFHSMNISA